MSALEFMREVVRMCRSCENCSQCVIDGYESCLWIDDDFSPEKFVQDVEQWAKEHPKKTRLQDFMEKYPHPIVNGNGIPAFLPYLLGYCGDVDKTSCGYCIMGDSRFPEKCWNMPVE